MDTIIVVHMQEYDEMINEQPLVQIENLKKYYSGKDSRGRRRIIKAVDGVSLHIHKGETFALVGESGCGKTTLGRLILRLEKETSGRILYSGQDITSLYPGNRGKVFKKMQIIYQNSARSLDPYLTVRESIAEPLWDQKMNRDDMQNYIEAMLRKVGMDPREMEKYPHELSGGQQQRVCIARALAVNPEFLFCDEPLTALDVSVQAQIVNLLLDLRDEYGLTCLFVSHDLAMARYISHRIGVMHRGKLVEVCDTPELYRHPMHPYTKDLLSSLPDRWEDSHLTTTRTTYVYSEIESCCPYAKRCTKAAEECYTAAPELVQVGDGHWCACHRLG